MGEVALLCVCAKCVRGGTTKPFLCETIDLRGCGERMKCGFCGFGR